MPTARSQLAQQVAPSENSLRCLPLCLFLLSTRACDSVTHAFHAQRSQFSVALHISRAGESHLTVWQLSALALVQKRAHVVPQGSVS